MGTAGSSRGGNDARGRRGKGAAQSSPEVEIDLDRPLPLVVLAVKATAASCRVLGTDQRITLRSERIWKTVPGQIVTVRGRKSWIYRGHVYLMGDIESTRLDIAALGLQPLELHPEGTWDPSEELWSEPDAPLADWEQRILERGPRPAFEMQAVLPGEDPSDEDWDPILEAVELRDSDEHREAWRVLMDLLKQDLRCLDAHAHLGNFIFDRWVGDALRHYEVGARIGDLSLGPGFDGVLPWGLIGNRPFLRCLHGMGLCLWRLGRRDEAAQVFDRMLWLNPTDNQGARFLLAEVRAGREWHP